MVCCFAILKEGICGLSILLRPMFKSEMPHWLVPLVSEMLHFIQFPLQTFKHVLLGCDQNVHIVAQSCTISHKIAQCGTKKWKFSMINVKITNLWDCKTYRWTIFNTRCVLDDSRSNTFLCLSSPPLFLHHFFTLTIQGDHFHFFSSWGTFSTHHCKPWSNIIICSNFQHITGIGWWSIKGVLMTIAGLLFETGVALLSPPLHLICFSKVRVSNLSTHNSDAIKILQSRVLCKKQNNLMKAM